MMLAMQCCGIETNGLDMISVPIIVFFKYYTCRSKTNDCMNL